MNLDDSFTTQVSNYYNWIQDLEYSSSGCNQIRFDFFSCSQSRKNLAHSMENSLHVKKTSVSSDSFPVFFCCREDTHQEWVKLMLTRTKVNFGLAATWRNCSVMAEPRWNIKEALSFSRCAIKMPSKRHWWDWEGMAKKGHCFTYIKTPAGDLLPVATCRYMKKAMSSAQSCLCMSGKSKTLNKTDQQNHCGLFWKQ